MQDVVEFELKGGEGVSSDSSRSSDTTDADEVSGGTPTGEQHWVYISTSLLAGRRHGGAAEPWVSCLLQLCNGPEHTKLT